MDISKIQEIHNKISELEKKAIETDSKKETHELEIQIRKLQDKFLDNLEEVLKEIPDKIKLKITVNKTVDFDTWDFKSWIADELLQRRDISDLNLIDELMISIKEDFDPSYEIDSGDINVIIDDDRFK